MKKYITFLLGLFLITILSGCDDNEFKAGFKPGFTFTGKFPTPTIFTNVGSPINTELVADANSEDIQKYTVKFETSGTGMLNDHDENVWFELDYTKSNFDMIFKPTSAGSHNIVITIKNQFDVIQTLQLTTQVENPSFNFTVNQNLFTTFQGYPIEINAKITQENTQNFTYNFKIVGELNKATITYESTIIQANVWYSISSPQNWTLTFSNPLQETKDFKIIVKNSVQEVTQSISSITVKQEFSFLTTEIKPVKVGSTVPLDLDISTQHSSNSKYFVKYSKKGTGNFSISSGDKDLQFETWYPVETLSLKILIKAIENSTEVDGSLIGVQIKDAYENTPPEQIKKFTIFNDPLIALNGNPIIYTYTSGDSMVSNYSITNKAVFTGRPYSIKEVVFEDLNVVDAGNGFMIPFPTNKYTVGGSQINFSNSSNTYSSIFQTPSVSKYKISATDEKGNSVSLSNQ